jgi:hypothetical protein
MNNIREKMDRSQFEKIISSITIPEDTPQDEGEPQDHEKENPETEHVHDWHYVSSAYSHWRECECGETEPVESHHFHLHSHTDMTCNDTSHDEYVCEECG